MNRHIASVHEELKPFICEICDNSFSQKSKMNKHVMSVHERKIRSNVMSVITPLI